MTGVPAMKRILLIVGGGIAAYKACALIRLARKAGIGVRCVLTQSGAQFVTPMTLAALSENQVFTSLWDLKDETEMGHIQLSREADLVVVAPATADLLAKMAAGIADDLATTLLLATDTPVLAAPAMNVIGSITVEISVSVFMTSFMRLLCTLRYASSALVTRSR